MAVLQRLPAASRLLSFLPSQDPTLCLNQNQNLMYYLHQLLHLHPPYSQEATMALERVPSLAKFLMRALPQTAVRYIMLAAPWATALHLMRPFPQAFLLRSRLRFRVHHGYL